MFIGAGTAINVATVIVGSLFGLALGHRFPERTRLVVTQILGLVSLVIGGLSVAQGMSVALGEAVGPNARLLIVLAALLIGGVLGSLIRLEDRLDGAAEWLRERFASKSDQTTFIEASVTATLIFCVGPLSILGSLSDGMGHGAEQLIVKAVMDGFAAMAFASTLGIGVAFSAIPLALYQGTLTMTGFWLGNVLPIAQLDSITATGGVILLGLGLRLLGIKQVPIGDMLPALIAAPLLVAAVTAFS
ncbi:DUF554 domain-containing protein [Propionicimonas sp.]|jgi:hypothetical protein|uniref:DUF554 domain-containing protein n=1 Tax=Propionicimonas sp. TaxID=1955623 RepID=UPI00179D0D44|nr:DUF554 domain-containing protein [Propionicimonas sp.]MBU3977409.1 DUF554 domain-containing protein [Actinomycetota bacterium]MBA3021333.1 DUF554 domain-containing protein [Propionicimonas sp.]MBU3985919.1 DUF554 domain-containing protein [Actinomycetota bacterium]MBU4008704.1 DUF554 domain-containing protein [Actinomycetota bacterium]MBU4066146.1 DUF554 domain-containing protein [Actinomycetota bacterium]